MCVYFNAPVVHNTLHQGLQKCKMKTTGNSKLAFPVSIIEIHGVDLCFISRSLFLSKYNLLNKALNRRQDVLPLALVFAPLCFDEVQ